MKQKISVSSVFLFLILVFYSCQKDLTSTPGSEKLSTAYSNSSTEEGDPIAAPVCAEFLRTQTPGGWGASPSGNNPGAYLHANFAAAFPNGLAIGCYPSNFYVMFTSAQAITDYLPGGGKPKPLNDNYIDPFTDDLKNTLVSHVTALSLSIGFDIYDPNFAQSGYNLGSMIVTSGRFSNMSVNEILAEAHKILGGCGGSFATADMVQVLDQINNNYVDGTTNSGFLNCPESRIEPER